MLVSTARAADWHHLHLTCTNQKEAAEWYAKYMGGQAIRFGGIMDIAVFGKTAVVFFVKPAGFEGSVGSTVDHVGWSFKDLDAKMKEFEAAGIKILSKPTTIGKIKFAFIEDPYGTKIEVMQDPDLYGFHHVHLHAKNPDEMLKFYKDAFGGEITKYGGFLPAIRYGDMWLICQKQPGDKAGTQGRSIDHISWKYDDLDKEFARLKAAGVKTTSDPRPFANLKVAFIEAPGGVRIELVQEMAPPQVTIPGAPQAPGAKPEAKKAEPAAPAAEKKN